MVDLIFVVRLIFPKIERLIQKIFAIKFENWTVLIGILLTQTLLFYRTFYATLNSLKNFQKTFPSLQSDKAAHSKGPTRQKGDQKFCPKKFTNDSRKG